MKNRTGYTATAPTLIIPPKREDSGISPLRVLDLGAATDPGLVRKKNEDHYLVMRFSRALEMVSTNLNEGVLSHNSELIGYAMLVADGMGGMAAGEVASSTALARLVELVVNTPDWMMSLSGQQESTTVMDRMSQRFREIDKTLKAKADLDVTMSGMGTTLTVAGSLDHDLVIGHIGDSRTYLLRGNSLSQLTSDHTLAQTLIDAGVARPSDPAARKMRHVLTSALGFMGKDVIPELHHVRLTDGDQILLCTDGLTEMVDDTKIASVLRKTDSAQNACEELIDQALAGGGSDNVTVVLARFGYAGVK